MERQLLWAFVTDMEHKCRKKVTISVPAFLPVACLFLWLLPQVSAIYGDLHNMGGATNTVTLPDIGPIPRLSVT